MPPPRRVLILSADVGEGHVAAARALAAELEGGGGVEVAHVDGLHALGGFLRHLIRDGYRLQLRYAPWSFNLLYALFRRFPPARSLGKRALFWDRPPRRGRRARPQRRLSPTVAVPETKQPLPPDRRPTVKTAVATSMRPSLRNAIRHSTSGAWDPALLGGHLGIAATTRRSAPGKLPTARQRYMYTEFRTMRIVVPDLISNSYFPMIASVELGCLRDESIDATVELLFPVDAAYRALAAGEVDVVAGSAHSALSAFPEWKGVKLLAAQGQGMYWFLVMRADLDAERGDVSVLRGKHIGAAPWVNLGLQQLVVDAGLDLGDVDIAPVPGAAGSGTNFGLTAARALADRKIDGFWANGMGAEVAVRSGAGTLVLDIRRGDGTPGCFDYTFASLAATDAFIAKDRGRAQAIVRALRRAHALLAEDPERATAVGERVFPPEQAALIAELVRRDVPYYDAEIPERAVAGMNRFARARGLLRGNPAYQEIVAVDIDRG